MGLFDKFNDSVMFLNPCPPGCETCCPLDIQFTFDPVTNILTLTYIYDNETVTQTVNISHSFDLELILNGTILELTGEHDGTSILTSIDLAPILPNVPSGLYFNESNITYYNSSGTLLLSEYIIVSTQNSITVTLPANPVLGQMYKVYNTTNNMTILPNVGQTIGSLLSLTLALDESVILQYIKTNIWGVIKI